MIARDIMTPEPRYVDVDATLEEVMDLLYELDIRHVPVTRGGTGLVGMISDRDIRDYMEADLPRVKAGEAMQGGVLMANPETEVSEILDMLIEHRVGAIPIVDPAEQDLVGIVSYIDMLKLMQEGMS